LVGFCSDHAEPRVSTDTTCAQTLYPFYGLLLRPCRTPGFKGTSRNWTNPLMGFCSDHAEPRVSTDATHTDLVHHIP
jgi:hypothetical protein